MYRDSNGGPDTVEWHAYTGHKDLERLQEEAADGLDDLTEESRKASAQAKDEKRPPGFTTTEFGKPVIVDLVEMEKAAEAIHEACDGVGTNFDAIKTILKDKSEEERGLINSYYNANYGISLKAEFTAEMSGAQLDQAINLIERKDGSADNAGRIQTALVEMGQSLEGRSPKRCEQDIRDTIATLSFAQIEKLKADHKDLAERKNEGRTKEELEREGKHYFEPDLTKALLEDENLSEATKNALRIYLNGADRRIDSETLELAAIALEARDIDMFQEAFRNATPRARERFMQEEGEQRMKEAFEGHWYNAGLHINPVLRHLKGNEIGNLTDADLRHARQFVETGSVSTTTLIEESQSWAGDNEAAIEKTLERMTDAERAQYARGKELAGQELDDANLSEQDTKSVKFYKELRAALEDAGHDSEVCAWESKIASCSLASKLAGHGGAIYDSNINAVMKDIENMTKGEWEELRGADGQKYGKESREQIQRTLKTYLSDADVNRCMNIVDKKMAARDFKEACESGRRPILDALKDIKRDPELVGLTDHYREEDVYRALAHITPEEQAELRNNPKKLEELKDAALELLDGREEAIANKIFDRITAGKPPAEDIVVKLYIHAADADTDETGVVRDLNDELIKNPGLKERLLHPKTEEEESYRREVEEALHAALGDSEYEKYAEPWLKTGKLPLETIADLHSGVEDDEVGFFKLLAGAEPADLQRLASDESYQKRVLGFLSEKEREVAINIAKQGGEIRPEDGLRMYMLGAGTDEAGIRETFANLKAEEKVPARQAFANKYGEDLTYTALDELGGQDALEVSRAIRRESESAQVAFNDARDEYYKSRDGFGSGFVDALWDGTGYQADKAYHDTSRWMTENAGQIDQLSPEKQKELKALIDDYQQSMDMFRESKGAVADGLTDAGIAVGCTLAGFVTEGSTWVLLGSLVAGGVFKAGGKGAIMGADYDWDSSEAVTDFAAGGVDAALNFVTFGTGSSASRAILEGGGWALLREGAEEALEKGLTSIVKETIESGSREISEESIERLVRGLAREGIGDAERAALRKSITDNLGKAVKQEMEPFLQSLIREALPAMEAGAVGGGAGSGTVRALAQWDDSQSFTKNMAMVGRIAATSAVFGAGGALAFTSVFKVGGKAFDAISNQYKLKPGEKLSPEQLADLAEMSGGKGASASYNQVGDIELKIEAGHETTHTEGAEARDVANGESKWDRHGGDVAEPAIAGKVDADLADAEVIFDRAGIPAEKRAELLAPMRGNPLSRVEAMRGFAEDMQGIMSKWEDISGLEQATLSAAEEMDAALDRCRDKVFELRLAPDGSNRQELRNLLHDVDKARREFAHEKEVLQLLDDYGKSCENYAELSRRQRGTLDQRAAEIETLVNRLADSQQLPRVKVTPQHEFRMRSAAASYGDGDLFIKMSMLESNEKALALMEAVYHEFVHNRQSSLIVSSIVEDVEHRLGTAIRVEDFNRLQHLKATKSNGGSLTTGETLELEALENRFDELRRQHLEQRGKDISDNHLREVLRTRGDDALTPEAKLWADQLAQSERTIGEHGTRFHRATEELAGTAYGIKALDEPDGAYNLIAKLSTDDGNLTRHLFGDKHLPFEIQALVAEFKRVQAGEKPNWSEEYAREALLDRLNERAELLELQQKRHFRNYLSSAHELEAWIIAGALKADVQELGGTRFAGLRMDASVAAEAWVHTPLAEIPVVAGNDSSRLEAGFSGRQAGGDVPLAGEGAQPLPDLARNTAPDVPARVGEIFDRAGTPAEERAALLAYIGENSLAEAEVMDRFGRRARELMSNWKDLSQIREGAALSEDALWDAWDRYRDKVFERRIAPDRSNEDELMDLLAHSEEARKVFAGDPEVVSLLDEYVRARDYHASVTSPAVEQQRIAEIEGLLNQLADEEGLPRVRVRLSDEEAMMGSVGTYSPGRGIVTLRDSDVLRATSPSGNLDLMNTMYHELVHSAQDKLLVSSVIDDAERRYGRSLTAEGLDRLRDLKATSKAGSISPQQTSELAELEILFGDVHKQYSERLGGQLQDEHLREILRVRAGAPLTPEERLRVGQLTESWETIRDFTTRKAKIRDDLKVAKSELDKLNGPHAAQSLVRRLAEDNGTLSSHLFGAPEPPLDVQILIGTYRAICAGQQVDSLSDAAQEVLTEWLQKRIAERWTDGHELYLDHYFGFHELEATFIGDVLRRRALEQALNDIKWFD